MAKMKWWDWTAFALMAVGAIAWGLFPMGINLVEMIFGAFAKWVFYLVGIAGVYGAYSFYNLATK